MEVVQEKYYDFLKFWDWAISVSDPRVKDWFLMESPIPTLAITAFYVFIVNLGMRAMERFDPFKFKYVLFVYNMGLVALNFYISSTLLYYSTKAGYSYQCQSVKYTYEENEYNIAKSLYWFYISKFYEMLDTIFFVLRKKNNQVSFLHVYHHASMFPLWWIGIKWVAGGQSFFGAMVNSFIHVIMYTYYGISALGPEYQKYLWWKRYLTILQLTQFFIGMVYGMQSLYLRCDFPLWMQYTGLAYGVSIITLFLNFYIQAYIKKKPTPIAEMQFCIGILHAVQSVFFKCDFPEWMHWALIFYAFTILMLFLNFYFHAYMKSMRNKAKQKKDKQIANGNLANGDHKSVSHANGHTETRKRK